MVVWETSKAKCSHVIWFLSIGGRPITDLGKHQLSCECFNAACSDLFACVVVTCSAEICSYSIRK